MLPVIIWDAEKRAPCGQDALGLPRPEGLRRPRPIHARSETIDEKEPFRTPFHSGQRGIVVFRTFNWVAVRAGRKLALPFGSTLC